MRHDSYQPKRRFAWLPTYVPVSGGGYWIWWEHYYERFIGIATEVWQ